MQCKNIIILQKSLVYQIINLVRRVNFVSTMWICWGPLVTYMQDMYILSIFFNVLHIFIVLATAQYECIPYRFPRIIVFNAQRCQKYCWEGNTIAIIVLQ
jgi:hypothetical protein